MPVNRRERGATSPANCSRRGGDLGAALGTLFCSPCSASRWHPVLRVFASAPPLHLAMHWRLAWGGFDVALAVLLAATGLALFRRSALAEVLAAMTATLLCCDARLDVLSSAGQGTSATVIATGEAAFVELPLAALFTCVAVRFARAVAEARPALQRAGFRIRQRRLGRL